MPGRDLRVESRVAVSRRGKLNSGQTWFPCMVLDMSNHGFLMLCARELAVGQVLDFNCELYPERTLDCKVEVRHSGEDALGTKIVEIDPRAQNLCQQFLEEQYSEKLNKLG